MDRGSAGLTYAIPESLTELHVGDRVLVPLGKKNKSVPGYVVRIAPDLASAKIAPKVVPRIKPIHSRDRLGLSLPEDLLELGGWISRYYCCPLGMVFASMLPAAVKHGTGSKQQTVVRLTDPPPTDTATAKPTKLQKQILAHAQEQAQQGHTWLEMKQLAAGAGARTVTPVRQLIQKGLLTTKQEVSLPTGPDPTAGHATPDTAQTPLQLTGDQQSAIDHITTHLHQGFGVHLLHGVTGSGKTEVYLRVIEQVLNALPPGATDGPAPGAIVMVPEIALTSQTVDRFMARFSGVAALHSGLTATQRHEQWRRIQQGKARIVVGARSAVFAPLPRVGVIIVDEEHDTSYKQDQLPRYHGRDVAIKRAQMLGVPVVLGSATPSLESYFNATHAGRPDAPPKKTYHLLSLPTRVAGLQLPTVQVVDMKEQRGAPPAHGHAPVLCNRLHQALQHTLDHQGQAVLLMNRRGYAHYIACPDTRCGWMMMCDYCDAMMTYHKMRRLPTDGVLRCHHCQAQQLLPASCPLCEKKLVMLGSGTQRVEETLAELFPTMRMLRVDSDTMRTAGDYRHALKAFADGGVDVLLGTQMIAKGLDFPNVRLVGVIDADTALHIPDFRSAERTFQLVAQVAGRTGRGDQSRSCTVIVQTFNPHDPAIMLASQHDYETFAKREIALRQQVGLPPWSRMTRIVVRDQNHAKCCEHAQTLGDQLRAFNTQLELAIQIHGPMEPPIARVAGYHRRQIELTAPDPGAASKLQRLLTELRNADLLRSDARTAVDVDPVSLL